MKIASFWSLKLKTLPEEEQAISVNLYTNDKILIKKSEIKTKDIHFVKEELLILDYVRTHDGNFNDISTIPTNKAPNPKSWNTK